MWDLAELGLDVAEMKAGGAAVTWSDIRPLPASSGAVELIEGESMEVIAATLADRLMADKVI